MTPGAAALLPAPLEWLRRGVDALILLGAIGLIAIVFGNAASRLAFNIDMAASLEVGTFLMLWVTFLGGAAAEARGAHLRVVELVAHLPRALHLAVFGLVDLTVVLVLLSLVWFGTAITVANWDQETSVLYWPRGLMYAAVPAGSALTLVFAAWHVWCGWTGPGLAAAAPNA